MHIQIKSGGYYTPDHIVDNEALTTLVDTSHEWIYSRTGVTQRRISTGETTSQLCAEACRRILARAQTAPEDIDILIVATITPDYLMPSTACLVQKHIGAAKAFAFDINAACSGFVYALSVGEKLLRASEYKTALIVGGETLSKILNWEDRGTCVLFGDGAGGVLLTKGETESFLAEDLHADGTKGLSLTAGHLPVHSSFAPEDPSADSPAFHLAMDGRAIFDFATRNIPESIRNVLEKGKTSLDELKYIVPHQANERITDTLAKKLKADPALFYRNVSRYGNTSAASIPIALGELFEQGLLQPGRGDKLVLSGFGGGLTWASLLIQI